MNAKSVFIPVLAGLIGGIAGNAVTSHFGGRETSSPAIAYAADADDQQRIVDTVKHAEPSVVALEATANGRQVVPIDPLGLFFALVPVEERASGSGFVYDRSGRILTDDHVVHGAEELTVVFKNGDRVRGRIVGENAATDVALVAVDNYAKLPPPLEIGASGAVQQGEWTIAIGEPLELRDTVTVGVASAFNRDEQIAGDDGVVRNFKGLLQTSAPINPGNSGGPLLDIEGRVIGINQSVNETAQGIGFAVPADTLKSTIASLEKASRSH